MEENKKTLTIPVVVDLELFVDSLDKIVAFVDADDDSE